MSPILFRLTLHRRGLRVLELEPVGRAARSIARSQALRDNTLQPHLAGVLEHKGAVPPSLSPWDANSTGPNTSFSVTGAAVLGCRAARAEMLSAGCMQCPSCSLSSMLVRKDPESAPLCPQCGDAMRLACKLPPVRPLSGLVVHLCGGCGYVGTAEREPDPPPPKWLQPTRGVRYSLFRAGTRERR